MIVLKENQLQTVVGGNSREKTIILNVPINVEYSDDVTITVYENGVLQTHRTQTINPAYVKLLELRFHGVADIIEVKIEINGIYYKSYELDFNSGLYIEK